MTHRTLGRRVARLEQWLAPERKHRMIVRYAGPGSERFPQPTAEELEQARHVLTLRFIPAKDGRPATPEEIARGYCSRGTVIPR
jgi:hypothetical protein